MFAHLSLGYVSIQTLLNEQLKRKAFGYAGTIGCELTVNPLPGSYAGVTGQ